MPDPVEAEALRAIEERLERAAQAAERLLAEAGAVPLRGWQRRADTDSADDDGVRGSTGQRRDGWIDGADARVLADALSQLRERIPPELERRLITALRELLLAVRALVDWCVERTERRSAAPAEVQDIPIL